MSRYEKSGRYEKPELISLSSKGQVVIPQSIRKKLGLTSQSQLLAYRYKDAVILKKVYVPNPIEEMRRIWREVDRRIAKYGELTEEDIRREIKRYRAEKRMQKGA